MNRLAVTPARVALLLAGVITLMVILWPLGLGRDYMNHLARTHIEGHLAGDPVLQQYYALSFDFIPDLAMDLIVPWLSHLIGTYTAGAVTIWMAFLLPPLAGLVLAKTLHGRITWLSLLGFLTVFNANMDWGFVNYNIASGLALLALALWIRTTAGWQRTLLFAPISLFLVINHALAFLMFGFLAFSWEVISYFKHQRGSLTAFVRQCVFVDLPAMALGLAYLFMSVQGASDLQQGVDPLYNFGQKARTLTAATEFGSLPIAFLAAFALVGFSWLAVRNQWVSFAEKSGWLCAAFLALVILIPTAVFGIWGLQLRYTAPLVILFGAAIVPSTAFTARLQHSTLAIFACVGAIVFTNGALQMAKIDGDWRRLQSTLQSVPEGSKILSAYSSQDIETAFTMHAASMAVIERSAYVPNLFTNTSPVDVLPGMVDLHMPQAYPLLPEALSARAAAPPQPSTNGYWSTAYANRWPETWDYLLYFKSSDDPGLSGFPVCEVDASATVILYKTGPCATTG
ncbi:MAG: hypothetical protein AAFZ91_02330 [Pseudomonadota bacterium]